MSKNHEFEKVSLLTLFELRQKLEEFEKTLLDSESCSSVFASDDFQKLTIFLSRAQHAVKVLANRDSELSREDASEIFVQSLAEEPTSETLSRSLVELFRN